MKIKYDQNCSIWESGKPISDQMKLYTYTPTKLPPVDMPWRTDERLILTPELPFFWWLSPWKTCEDLQLSLLKSVEYRRKDMDDHNASMQKLHDEWSKEYKATSDALEQVRSKHNAFQREVEVTLINVGAPTAYENTIELVQWAVDEIKRLRTERKKSRRK